MKYGNITANEVLIVGGVALAAYVIYKISNSASAITGAVSGAAKSVSDYASSVSSNYASHNLSDYNFWDVLTGKQDPLGDVLSAHLNSSSVDPTKTTVSNETSYDPANQTSPQLSYSNLITLDPLSTFSNPAQNPIFYSNGLSLTAPNGPTFN